MTEHISLTPLKESQVPHNRSDPNYDTFIHSLVTSSARFLDSLPPAGESNNIWQFHKTFHKSKCPTHTYSSNLDAPPPGVPRLGSFRWHLRVSLHAQSKYEDFRDGLLLNHSENEAKYIDSCVKADKLRTLEDGVLEVWRTAYKLGFPASNRDFTFLILTKETTPTEGGPRSFVVISIPYDAPHEKGWVRARYVSFEEVKETPEGLIWSMATASNAEGAVPSFVTEKAMPSKVSEDVPSFLKWLEKRSKPT